MSEFTDPLCAVDEAQWLANQTGYAHGVYDLGESMIVAPVHAVCEAPLEIVRAVE